VAPGGVVGMLCPWCMHYGAEDAEYTFDRELYCLICAQPMPRSDADWLRAFRAMDRAWYVYIEQELNRIGASKSGLDPPTRRRLAEAVDHWARLRLSGGAERGSLSDEEYAAWLRFACIYYAPQRA
jgi:hypothetical protein